MTAHPEQHPADHHGAGRACRHQLTGREDRGDQPLRISLRRSVAVDGGVDPRLGARLSAVGAHHRGADHRLRNRAQHVRNPFSDRPVALRKERLEAPYHNGHRHKRGIDNDGQRPGIDRHKHGRDQHLPGGQQQDHAAELQKLRHLVNIAGDPRGEGSPPLLQLGQRGQIVDMPENTYPQCRQRGLGHPIQADVHAVGRGGRHHDRQHRARRRPADHAQLGRSVQQAVVDGLLDRDRDHHSSRSGDERKSDGHRQARGELRYEPPDLTERHSQRLPGPGRSAAGVVGTGNRVSLVAGSVDHGAALRGHVIQPRIRILLAGRRNGDAHRVTAASSTVPTAPAPMAPSPGLSPSLLDW